MGYGPRGRKEWDTTERLQDQTSIKILSLCPSLQPPHRPGFPSGDSGVLFLNTSPLTFSSLPTIPNWLQASLSPVLFPSRVFIGLPALGLTSPQSFCHQSDLFHMSLLMKGLLSFSFALSVS